MEQIQSVSKRRRSRTKVQLDFDVLYRELRVPVYAYLHDALQNTATAEDVTATAFERAFRRRDTFDPRRGNERAWLFTIARSALMDHFRSSSATTEVASDGAADIADRQVDVEVGIAVRTAIAKLDRFERELVGLKFYAGLNNREIARVVDRSESSVGTTLHRILGRLKEACDA
jgi:RNA polymerase sigma-70 factor (ECF subfamily)